MNSVNLYNIIRSSDFSVSNKMLKSASNSVDSKIKQEEFDTLIDLINHLNINDISIYDGFFVDYTIPHISKEFDLLKINQRFECILNIELKCDYNDKKIERQLVRNRYYLNGLSKTLYLYTYVKGGLLYKYESDHIIKVDIEALRMILKNNKVLDYIEDNIDQYFMPSKFLISPINDINKFLNDEYYLNSHQEKVKDGVLKVLKDASKNVVIVQGSAGTGKTLLLYDIVKHLSRYEEAPSILVLFCGNLQTGHINLNKDLQNTDIMSIKSINNIRNNYDFVFVDEIQRLRFDSYISLKEYIRSNFKTKFILFGDEEQYLSVKERDNNHFKKLKDLAMNDAIFNLNNRVRSNVSMISFINKLLDKSKKMKRNCNLSCVDVCYATNLDVAIKYILYYKTKGYVYIGFTGARQGDKWYDSLNEYSDYNAHQVVGQEYDKVLVVLNSNFGYDKRSDGRVLLREKAPHPTNDYVYRKMLFQAVTRAKENLAIIVLNDIDLFNEIIDIKLNYYNNC